MMLPTWLPWDVYVHNVVLQNKHPLHGAGESLLDGVGRSQLIPGSQAVQRQRSQPDLLFLWVFLPPTPYADGLCGSHLDAEV